MEKINFFINLFKLFEKTPTKRAEKAKIKDIKKEHILSIEKLNRDWKNI
jgi:hypothetical protein